MFLPPENWTDSQIRDQCGFCGRDGSGAGELRMSSDVAAAGAEVPACCDCHEIHCLPYTQMSWDSLKTLEEFNEEPASEPREVREGAEAIIDRRSGL